MLREKIKQGMGNKSWTAISNRVARAGLLEEGAFSSRLEGREGISRVVHCHHYYNMGEAVGV